MIPPPGQNAVGVCNQVTLLILYYNTLEKQSMNLQHVSTNSSQYWERSFKNRVAY
jgi:hypothetical protein